MERRETDVDTSADVRQVRYGVVRAVVGANFVAAVLLFLFNNILVADWREHLGMSLVRFLIVCAVAFPGTAALGVWFFRPVERWMIAERPPTSRELNLILLGPQRIGWLTFAFWSVTALLIGVTELADGGPDFDAARTALPVFAAGFTCSALTYLLVERRARPLVARALGGQAPSRPVSVGLRLRLVLSWALGSAVPLFVIAMGELSIGEQDPRVSAGAALFMACLGIVAGGLLTFVAVRSVAEPLDQVRRALTAVRMGDLSVTVPVDDSGEIGLLQSGVNDMVAGLRERQRLADLFGRHVGAEVARRALDQGVRLSGERRQASAMFVDIINSTGVAARSAPEDVVVMLNRFFDEVVRAVDAEQGWVNKFEGDGALCVFGAPVHQDDHAARALRSARRLRAALVRARLDAGIGVSSGEVVAGNVGTEERYEYTVIGDPVNEAARLTEAAKQRPEHVLASRAAVEVAEDEAGRWRPVARLRLRGRGRVTEAFAPVDEEG